MYVNDLGHNLPQHLLYNFGYHRMHGVPVPAGSGSTTHLEQLAFSFRFCSLENMSGNIYCAVREICGSFSFSFSLLAGMAICEQLDFDS